MAKWKDALAKSGLKAEKLNKKTREEIAEFEQLEGIRADAEAALADVTDDPTKSAEIAGDIQDMGKKMQKLDDKICVGITHASDIKEQQRARAAVSFGKGTKPAAVAAAGATVETPPPATATEPSTPPVQSTPPATAPVAAPPQTQPAQTSGKDDKDKNKDGGFGLIETVASIAFAGVCVWLGVSYHNDSFPFGGKKKR